MLVYAFYDSVKLAIPNSTVCHRLHVFLLIWLKTSAVLYIWKYVQSIMIRYLTDGDIPVFL